MATPQQMASLQRARQLRRENLAKRQGLPPPSKELAVAWAPSQDAITAFYESWEWKRLRYQHIKDRRRRCECCGQTPDDGVRIVVDHINPIRRFWDRRLDPNNLQLLCDDCNQGKGSRDTTDWRSEEEIFP